MPGLSSAYTHEGDRRMTGNLPRIQRGITTATETPTRLNRPDLVPAGSAEGRAGVEPVVQPAVAEAPILITEQQVIFGTAAAVRVPRNKTAGQWIALTRPRRLFTRSTADERAARHRHYPNHYEFLEQALMGREMDRL
jgi:hypothetical protein